MQPHTYSLTPESGSLEELIQKAKTFVAAAKAPATLKAYRNDWRDFESWCREHQLPSLPSTPETVALYIADRASTLASGTIARRLTSITKAHQAAGFTDSPATTRHFVVGETLKGIRRTIGTAQHGKAPLLLADVRRIITARREDLLGLRDSALVLVGFAGGFRRSELALIHVCDLKFSADGVVVTVRKSKTDQESAGSEVGLPFGSNLDTCRSARCATGSTGPGFEKARFSGRSADTVMSRGAASHEFDVSSSSVSQSGGLKVRRSAATPPRRLRDPGRDERRSRVRDHASTGHKTIATLRRYIGQARSFARTPRPASESKHANARRFTSRTPASERPGARNTGGSRA